MRNLSILFVLIYLYSLCFGLFLTTSIRIPIPIMAALPLLLFFRKEQIKLLYLKELLIIGIAIFLYDVVGLSEFKPFFASLITITIAALFFNYYVGTQEKRFNTAILIFYGWLLISALIMVINPVYPEKINNLRTLLMGEPVLQSPSGIAIYQFNFGYQLAALVTFLFIATYVFKTSVFLKTLVLLVALVFIYLGMQRSILVGFLVTAVLFLGLYFKFRSVFIIALAILAAALLYTVVLRDHFDSYHNIVAKNELNDEAYNRTTLSAENLRIMTEYPYGLIFYGKTWSDVIYRNEVFSSGITSHNAYLMFLTYLGPFLGLSLLALLYQKIVRITIAALRSIRRPENALMVCLCCSFLGVSLNSLSHNSWLLSPNGPTVFLYFAILHLDFMRRTRQHSLEPVQQQAIPTGFFLRKPMGNVKKPRGKMYPGILTNFQKTP
ncbi:O-antigen ligase family protein [Pedobacter gandavensis]|uniref:O-antigen ligase family protein n=1 Tax=Pedobacter gandavensis TaxID=2679963 RepID=UPI00293036A9|nr:O-antigen ligase family protein [Pedobacter gandavensis]